MTNLALNQNDGGNNCDKRSYGSNTIMTLRARNLRILYRKEST